MGRGQQSNTCTTRANLFVAASPRAATAAHHGHASHFKLAQLLLGDASLHLLSSRSSTNFINEADVNRKHSLERLCTRSNRRVASCSRYHRLQPFLHCINGTNCLPLARHAGHTANLHCVVLIETPKAHSALLLSLISISCC